MTLTVGTMCRRMRELTALHVQHLCPASAASNTPLSMGQLMATQPTEPKRRRLTDWLFYRDPPDNQVVLNSQELLDGMRRSSIIAEKRSTICSTLI